MQDFDDRPEAELWELATSEDAADRAAARVSLSKHAEAQGNLSDAFELANAARTEFHSIGADLDEGMVCFHSANLLLRMERNEDALAVITDAVTLYRSSAREEWLADALRRQADCYLQLDNDEGAYDSFESAIALYSSNDAFSLAGICCLDMGQQMGMSNDTQKALTTFARALELFQKGKDHIGSGRAHDRIAAALIDLGDRAAALVHLREALNIYTYTGDVPRIAYQQYRLGWTLVTEGENDEAIPLLRQSAAWHKANGDFAKAAEADTQLAHGLSAIGEMDEAMTLYAQVRSYYDAIGDFYNACISDVNAASRMMTTDLPLSITMFKRALSVAETLDVEWIVRSTVLRLADTLLMVETPESDAEAWDVLQTIEVDPSTDTIVDWSWHVVTVATALIRQDRFDEAEPLLREVIELSGEPGILAHRATAHVLQAEIEAHRGESAAERDMLVLAISLYLAAGEDSKARRLSQRLLPASTAPNRNLVRSDAMDSNDDHHEPGDSDLPSGVN